MNAPRNYTTRVQDLRKEKKLSQQKAADALGIAKLTYQRYEYGERDIPGEILVKMTNLFDASADYILKQSNYRERITYSLESLEGNGIHLSNEESQLLICFYSLSEEGQTLLLEIASTFVESGRFKKIVNSKNEIKIR